MPTKSKLSTPAWVLEGYDSKEEYEKFAKNSKSNSENEFSDSFKTKSFEDFGATKSRNQDFVGKRIKKQKSKNEKTFRLRICPKCGSDEVGVVLTGEEGKGAKEWECRKCKWQGKDIVERELTEDEFMKYLDEKDTENKKFSVSKTSRGNQEVSDEEVA